MDAPQKSRFDRDIDIVFNTHEQEMRAIDVKAFRDMRAMSHAEMLARVEELLKRPKIRDRSVWNLVAEKLEKQIAEARQPPVRLALPPRFWWGEVGRFVMSPASYKRWCEPHIADMHEQYYECVSHGDEWGARRAVIWAHIYAVPSWVWGVAAQLLLKLAHWIRA